ncbi:MAG TPA: sigma-70 family RNA polymerase sigma factor [Solirubrobacteraceae bacterium]|jgi:RNA polymerase sigma factor (sigma-70 family)
MSPLTLRRYRADRLLRAEFERMRGSVVGGVSQRLRAVGVQLDAGDLDACYAQAWQGLYASILAGSQIDSPEAWLARVTYRRAIDEHRARRRIKRAVPGRERPTASPTGSRNGATDAELAGLAQGEQRDLAERLDDRERLRQLFEALRCRLSTRERQAATLCYLHGLTRGEAAARMGVSERRMQKLMDGRGGGDLGVAQKVGALVETIAAGRWCDEQGSLMRGFAYGLLDPDGERYRLADAHRAACPACRAYVVSLRGLAAVLPPVPSLLHVLLAPGAAAGGGAVAAGTSAASGSGGAGAAGGTAAAGAASAGSGATALAGSTASSGSMLGALSASGGAGGSWWLASGVGVKLAAGCVLALGVGAGCVALGGGAASLQDHPRQRHATMRRTVDRPSRAASAAQTLAATASELAPSSAAGSPASSNANRASGASPARQAAREFGPEQSITAGGTSGPTAAAAAPVARAASVPTPSAAPQAAAGSEAGGGQSAGVWAAQREFAPG